MYKKSFITKIVILILMVSLIPTIFNSSIFYFSSSNIIKENVREASLQSARQAVDSLSFVLSTGSDMSDLIYSNMRLQEIVKHDLYEELPFSISHDEYMVSYLNEQTFASSFVRMIYILKEEGRSWGSGDFSRYKFTQYNSHELDWLNETIELDGEIYWQGLQIERFSGAGEGTEYVLPINRVMKDFDNLNNIAFIQVLLDGNAILDSINKIKLGKSGYFFVVDQHGKVVIDANTENINQTITNETLFYHVINTNDLEFEYKDEGIPYYGVKQLLSNGWTIVGIVPVEEITGQLTTIQMIVLLSSIGFATLAIFIGYILAYRVTNPMKVLTSQMKQVGKGNLNVRTSVKTSDEIGMMSLEFNRMVEKVEQLMEQVKMEQIQKKDAEIRAVKHRINPHFLFNTLSTIRWLVKFNQVDRANTALSALTKLLEANMGKKGTFVTLSEEVDIIQKFIDIMEIRYDQKFFLELNIDNEVSNFLIPQMILQPVVENSIFHGIVPLGIEGVIKISAHKLESGVEIEITDNGKGIEQDTLNKLQRTGLSNEVSTGIGLLHIFDSVKLYFNPESTVDINSSNTGTIVRLFLLSKDGGE